MAAAWGRWVMRDRDSVFTMLVASTSLFTIGLFIASTGPLLPELAARTDTSLAIIGSVITGLFLGAVPTQLVAGPVIDRFGPKAPLAVGYTLMAFGALVLSLGTALPVLLAASISIGVGNGLLIVTVNLLVIRAFRQRAMSALNLVNLFYGVGAILGPLLVAAAVTITGFGAPVLFIVAAAMFLQIGLVPFLVVPTSEAQHMQSQDRRLGSISPLVWTIVLVVLVYAGTENGIAAWATTMIEQSTGTERATAAIVTSGFWLALTAGRLIVASVGGRLSGVHVLFGCLVLATVGSVILMVGQQSLAVSAGAYLVIGFAFGPIFPTAVAIAGQITPKLASISTSLVITGASFGSMIIPLGQGAAIEHGGVFAGTGVVLAAHVVMLVLMGAGLVVFARRKTVDA